MDELVKVASEYGGLGLVLLASFWFINKKDDESKIERANLWQTSERRHTEILIALAKNGETMQEIVDTIKNK